MMLFTIINAVSNTHLQKYSIIILLTILAKVLFFSFVRVLQCKIRYGFQFNFYMFVVESLCGVGNTVTHSTPMSECKQGGAEDTT